MCQSNNEAAMCINHECEPVECTDESHCSSDKELCQNAKCVEQECRAHDHCDGFFGKKKPAKVKNKVFSLIWHLVGYSFLKIIFFSVSTVNAKRLNVRLLLTVPPMSSATKQLILVSSQNARDMPAVKPSKAVKVSWVSFESAISQISVSFLL